MLIDSFISPQVNAFKCTCQAGFAGHQCEINIDDCKPMPCLNNATCIDVIANYTCSCLNGFTGLHCENRIDYCRDANCTQNGVCVNLLTGKSHSKAWILCNRCYRFATSTPVYIQTFCYSDCCDHPNEPLVARSPQWALWQLNSHRVSLKRKESHIINYVISLFFFFLPHCVSCLLPNVTAKL